MNRIIGLLVLFLASSSAAAPHAAPKVDAARIGVDCKDDFKRLCKDASGSVLACMQAHRSEASPACLAAMDAGKTGAPAAKGAKPKSCKDDFVRVCKGAKSGELKTCLKAHRAELTDFCRKIFDMTEAKDKKPAR